ncbi:MAG TPA: 2-oxo acid dehydrogenase subunit E2 [Verrucomicrobiae bacterium]
MDVKLPKLGEGADSGVVVGILVKEGDKVTKGQTIIELENEKAVAPIPATADGVVSKIHVKEGAKISIGALLITLDGGSGGGAAAPAEAPAAKAAAPKAKKKAAPVVVEEEEEADDDSGDEGEEESFDDVEVAAPPSVRKVAREIGLDLRRVKGSEAGGRVVMADVRVYIQKLIKLAAKGKAAPAAAPAAAAAPAKPVAESIDFSQWGDITKKPMTGLRKVIARRMVESVTTIPQVTQFDDVDITALNDLRKKFSADYEKAGARLTLTPFAIKALVAALKKHPIMNSSMDEVTEEIVFKNYYHIGIAVDTEAGLMVPVIKDADKKSLLEISKELEEIAKKARDRKLSPDDMKGGTFTISNQGGIGGAHFTPIVNKPEVGIFGMGRGALKPVVVGKEVQVRLMMPIAISYDHRLIDGGTAARFTVDLIAAYAAMTDADVKL